MSQRVLDYYNKTADQYDVLHGGEQNAEHMRALNDALPLLQSMNIASALEVGCGTGRSLARLAELLPGIKLHGVEPSVELLKIARQQLPDADLNEGSGERLSMGDDAADLVFATGIMHHVDDPNVVIREMFRVARKAVLISDHNNFAFGSAKMRRLRLWLYASGLLGAVTFIKQGFRRQGYSQDDGWWYPYSLLENHRTISQLSQRMYLMPTRPVVSGPFGNFMQTQTHFAVLAVKAGATV